MGVFGRLEHKDLRELKADFTPKILYKMKNQALLIALKWSGIQYAALIAIAFIGFYLTNALDSIGVLASVLMYGIQIAFFVIALRELELKMGKNMTAPRAFELLGWFMGIGLMLSFLAFFIMDIFSSSKSMDLSDLMSASSIGLMLVAMLGYMFFIYTIPLAIYGIWRVFTKAGKPGWASIVPIYNAVVQCEIAQRPAWWVIMLFIPFVNIVFVVMLSNGISKAFGKEEGFTVGLVLLPFVFYPMLGFGPDRWIYGPEPVAVDENPIEEHLVD